MTHFDAQALRSPVTDMAEAEKRISRLRTDIGKLGNPNIGAIESTKGFPSDTSTLLHTGRYTKVGKRAYRDNRRDY
jgi:hypothetical protein